MNKLIIRFSKKENLFNFFHLVHKFIDFLVFNMKKLLFFFLLLHFKTKIIYKILKKYEKNFLFSFFFVLLIYSFFRSALIILF